MVALPGLLEALEVLLQLLLVEEGRAVDAGEHLARLVAAPVGAGERGQLEGADPARRGPMRPAAEVLELAVSVERDRLRALVADQVLDQLDLVVLSLLTEVLDRLGGRQLPALEGLVGLDVLLHPLFDPGEVLFAWAAVREIDVVVEAVGDRRPDRDLRVGPDVEH